VLKNSFRRLLATIILLVFGLAVYRFVQQTQGNPYVGGALASGLKLLLFLALVLWAVYLFDRRLKRGRSR
jgi:di/tricarboxylate transporter